MGHLSMRDLQKISAKAISELPGATAIKSGDRTVALLTPLKRPDMAKLEAALKLADELAKDRDPEEDEAFLEAEGIDPTNWTVEAVRALTAPDR